ncbi:hypothetical protein LZC95_04655 [Pendulispora brunnea]|uniref:Uncharacterized protein n=1 Tax=Pendulispora brunnea TaxID=2905690 RepID=A0ABZ2KFL6_9BACT
MKQVTVANIVCRAYRCLGDLEQIVTSSRRIGYGTTQEQASTLADLRHHLVRIKSALGKMEKAKSEHDGMAAQMTDERTEALANIGNNLSAVQATLQRVESSLRQRATAL